MADSFEKRQRERKKQQKKREKAQRKRDRAAGIAGESVEGEPGEGEPSDGEAEMDGGVDGQAASPARSPSAIDESTEPAEPARLDERAADGIEPPRRP